MTKIIKLLAVISLLLGVVSCTSGDPYATVKVNKLPSTSATPSVPKPVEPKVPETPKNTQTTIEDEKFDATDQKIVDFIDQKVYEDGTQIKKITIESIQKLKDEKNIRMTKREFLARTYQIIRDNNMTSFYLAVARLLNEIK